MPAGCEFICKNINCEQYNNGFSITGPWPIGKIELIISISITGPWPIGKIELIISSLSSKLRKNEDFLNGLIKFKNEGRKYACITCPNVDGIEIIGYRINLWSPEAKCIWNFDVESNGKSLEESLLDANLPTQCPKTGCNLLSFNEITQEGINCPYCNEKMFQSRWFSNEK